MLVVCQYALKVCYFLSAALTPLHGLFMGSRLNNDHFLCCALKLHLHALQYAQK